MSVPVIAAGFSPLLQWRQPIYIIGGFAGILAMALMLMQPLLAPGVAPVASRRVHQALGLMIVLLVVVHVAGLWITSPPDVIDVLLFRSPTPFGVWGALAMWAVFAAGVLAVFRQRLGLRLWRWGHTGAVSLAVIGTALHAIQIDGAMEGVTKAILAVLVCIALGLAVLRRRVWAIGLRRR